MKSVPSFNPSFNPLDKARRHHRMKKGRPLVAGAGRVVANGKLRVELRTVDGETVSYIAIPTMSWRFEPDTSVRPKANRVPTPASPADRFKRAIDTALTELADLERRGRAASPNIAAE
jgi:hypothetical protein